MQSGPANQFYGVLLQVEIAGQYGLNITRITVHIHRLTQFDHTAEFIAAAVLRVGQDELCVVFRGPGVRLRQARISICETEHKTPD